MTDQFHITGYLNIFILNQRKVNSQFRKETGLNRTNLEILSFANSVISFNPYQVQQKFNEMNLQQVRLGIRKLVTIGALEILLSGARNKPAVYLISKLGKEILVSYTQSWLPNIAANNALALKPDKLA